MMGLFHYVATNKMAADILQNPYRVAVGNIQNCFDGNRQYATSSSLSEGARISIKLKSWP